MATLVTDGASPLPRACTALTKSEEKERLLAVYETYEDRVRVPPNTKYLRKNPTGTGLCTPSHTPAVVQFRYS